MRINSIEEFVRLMPFVLAFIPKIGKVTIVNNSQVIAFERHPDIINDFIVQVCRTENNQIQNIQIAASQNEKVAVALEIDAKTNSVKEFKNVPRLFCDFPLIGTERFYFPTVVNSFYFNPRSERQGIWLRGDDDAEVQENRTILIQAVSLYEDLISKLSRLGIRELFHAATTKLPDVDEEHFDVSWYENKIQLELRKAIIRIPIVDTVNHRRQEIESSEGKTLVHFPYDAEKEIREQLWHLADGLKDSVVKIPVLESIERWNDVIWWHENSRIDIKTFANFIQECKSLIQLEGHLKKDQNVFCWINNFYALIIEKREIELFSKYAIVLNQNGDFKHLDNGISKNPILFVDGINDETLLEVLRVTGSDWKEYLIHNEVKAALTNAILKKEDIAFKITEVIKSYKGNFTEIAIKSIVLLVEWFDHNPEIGQKLFSELYMKRAELFMETITIEDKESLYQVMKSKTPLSTLSEIALAIQNDPEILDIIAQRQQEILEEKERNEIGEVVESILAEVLKDLGFSVQKEQVGRDLVISLNGRLSYDIEVKSTNTGGFVSMTPTQAQTAVEKKNNYALCVVHKSGLPLTKDYVRQNARFVIDIGSSVANKVVEVSTFSNSQRQLFNANEDVGLLLENAMNFKYKVSANIWSKGVDIQAFINHVKDESGLEKVSTFLGIPRRAGVF